MFKQNSFPKISFPEITFPEIRALKAKLALTDADIGEVIGNNYQTVSKKLRLIYDFTFSDMLKIVAFFQSKTIDEKEKVKITMDFLFFDWVFSNENLSA